MEYYKNLSLEDLFYIDDDGLVCCEEWRDIPDYIGRYQASDLGRIKSNTKYKRTTDVILKQHSHKGGYLKVALHKNSKGKTRDVHILVAESFLGHIPCGRKLEVDHKFENKFDNRASMLQIITHRENSSKYQKNTTSKYTGVYLDRTNDVWRALICIDYKDVCLGSFKTEEEASVYYQNALYNHNNNLPIEKKLRKKTSKYKGVHFCKFYNKWFCKKMANKKNYHSGYFKTEIEAYNAYQELIKNI